MEKCKKFCIVNKLYKSHSNFKKKIQILNLLKFIVYKIKIPLFFILCKSKCEFVS